MKRGYLLVTALAAVGSMITAGCSETPTSSMQGADPTEVVVGKNGNGNGGGGKTRNNVSVTLDEGAVTAHALTAKVSADNDSKLEFGGGTVNVQIQLLNTSANHESCTLEGDPSYREALVAQLTTPAPDANFSVQVDKLSFGSPSDINTFLIVYNDPAHPELGTIRLGIPAHGNPPPTVEEIFNDGTNRTYRFHSGVIRVWALGGRGKNSIDARLFCSNLSPTDGGDTILVSTTKI